MGDNVIDTIEKADVALSVRAGQLRDHPAVEAAGFLSEIADQGPAYTLAAVALGAGLLTGRPRLAQAGGRALLSIFVATRIKGNIKAVVVRTRPAKLLDEGRYETGLNGPDRGDYNSFPSGHTADAVASARAIRRAAPAAAVPLTLVAAGIGLIQVPRARHHLLDVIAGAVVGAVAEAVADAAWTVAARALAERAGNGTGAGTGAGDRRGAGVRPSTPRFPAGRSG